jgi:uncharacterized protein YfaS (alpha-2-macroglobulin family)
LPRFLRYGDRFEAGLLARIVEGSGGAGAASIAADGLTLEGNGDLTFAWEQNKPAHLGVLATAPETAPDGKDVRLHFGLERVADHAHDAVDVTLPLKSDIVPIKHFEIIDIPPGGSKTVSVPEGDIRPGSLERDITLASDPAVIKLLAGLNALVETPYGSTEQRISLSSAGVALKSFAPLFAASGLDKRIDDDVHNTVLAIGQAVDADGLVGFWPHSKGNVSLTAWAYSFLVAADKAGEPTDKALTDRLANVLKLSLRSDYPHLITGNELRERAEALTALGEGGKLDPAYMAELARSAAQMPNVSVARMVTVGAGAPDADQRLVGNLTETMWSRVRFLSRDGQLVYDGQAQDGGNPLILPSEALSLAEMVRAAALTSPTDPRYAALKSALLQVGEGDGWGSSHATAAAIRALAAALQISTQPLPLTLSVNGQVQSVGLDAGTPVLRQVNRDPGVITISNAGSAPAVALVETRYLSAEAGYRAQAESQGFALTRTLYRVPAGDAPLEKLAPDEKGAIQLHVGDILEEKIDLAVPEDRTHVALSLPLAAGLDPLNPAIAIATAPPEATPATASTLPADWVSYGDDQVLCAADTLAKGNYTFSYRTRALIAGTYTQPQATVETMYQKGVRATSAAVQIAVTK